MRDFVVCVYSMSIVRITGKELPRRNQLYETLTQDSRAKNPKMSHQLYVALNHHSWFNDVKNVNNA